jgi:hypothetical protein
LQVQYPSSRALQSILQQLEYLIDLQSGRTSDKSRLKDINLDVLAAREIEDRDQNTARILYSVYAEVKGM